MIWIFLIVCFAALVWLQFYAASVDAQCDHERRMHNVECERQAWQKYYDALDELNKHK